MDGVCIGLWKVFFFFFFLLLLLFYPIRLSAFMFIVFRIGLSLQFQKVQFKITILKCAI
jgi:hypothetical protein